MMLEQSTISNKYPSYRKDAIITSYSWLDCKRIDDNAEGLWRIHDSLYDLTDFIDHHPGGPDWLRLTKGTDITELFEAHHISEKPLRMSKKYKIRDAKDPRNITLTLKEDGFYRTLKSRVREKLQTIDLKKYNKKSDRIHFFLLFLTYLLSVASGFYHSKILAAIAGVSLTWTVIIAHNYFHRKDNWRMYTFNLSLMNYKDWRISHAMSHHIFPNSFHDLELTMFEPFLCWVPSPFAKNLVQRYGSWIYGPIIYPLTSIMQFCRRLIYSAVKGINVFDWSDLLPLTIPLAMLLASDVHVLNVLTMWLIIILSSGFAFTLIGLNTAHHHPDSSHEGDSIRANRDWGLFQMDTIIDRYDLKGSEFLVLTNFGEHTLHHLFPTLDHGVLPHLYPVFYETIEEFQGELRECNWIEHIIGQMRQLARVTPNPNPPKKLE